MKKQSSKLTAESENKAIEVFGLFKTNNEGLVDEEKFVNNWTGLTERLSAIEFFEIID